MTTPLPRGIERDATEHGKLYYTRTQLLEYGQRCAEDSQKRIDASRMKSNASGQPEIVDFLKGHFGRKP